MSAQRTLLIVLLIVALLVPGASAFLAQPAASSAALAPARASAAPGDEYWDPGFLYPGINGSVLAVVVGPNGSLYAGGHFTSVGSLMADYIAQFDGAQWHSLGSGMNREVTTLAVGLDGSLYAGGQFTNAGGVTANYVARWDGTRWYPLGNGMNGAVRSLAFGPDGSLYVGGFFTTAGGIAANRIARWDGSQWYPLGDGVGGTYDASIGALAFGPDGSLYAGGYFTTAGGIAANYVARWDGAQWYPLGSGLGGAHPSIEALTFGPDDSLYAMGGFTTAGGIAANYIARWDGSQWHPLGSGMGGDYYLGIGALAFGPDGFLYAGGYFTTAGGIAANYVARWDGAQWYPLGNGMNGAVRSLAFGPNGSLFVGGSFSAAGGVAASNIARWDGSGWYPVSVFSGGGVSYVVEGLSVGPDGSLYAGGPFSAAGGVRANRIARWDGSLWHPLGSGLDQWGAWDIAIGSDGSLYAGGLFTTAGGAAANNIALWDGIQWHPLGSGIGGSSGTRVEALAVGPDGSLFAGGWFSTAGGIAARNIARWDGAQWHPLGSGLNETVLALVFGPDGSLYAGGSFSAAGGVAANRIARWDGSQWYSLGNGMNSEVSALAFGPDGSLYAGGLFTTAGGVAANYIARWDGAQWHPLGSGVGGGRVRALAFGPDGSLYAGGQFDTAGGVAANRIARWDGSQWHPLGSGMGGYALPGVHALTLLPDGSLYAGGYFTTAGAKASSYIARWTGEVVEPYEPNVLAPVEQPQAGASVSGAVTLRGFAIDLGSTTGTGIDMVHIYLDGPYGAGTIIGAATYGLDRPDVATQYGARFGPSGWELTWDTAGLAPGTHRLYLYAHRTTDNAWSAMEPHVVVVPGGPARWLPIVLRRQR